MSFWCELGEESRKVVEELPPLTGEVLVAFELEHGVKLPQALVALLQSKNGGYLENRDFKFHGEDHQVREILGVSEADNFWSMGTYASLLDNPDMVESVKQLHQQAGDPARLLLFARADHISFALNYNRLNDCGEPKVVSIHFVDAETVEVERVADTFAEFLAGQYAGDDTPIVDLNEPDRCRLVATGGYSGTHEASGNRVEIGWKICLDGDCILVFQEEDWGFGKKVTRMQINQSQLRESSGVLDFLFGLYQRFLLWRTGKEIGADLSQLANTKRLCISKEDAPLKPPCFNLTFHTHALGDELSADSWIRVRTAEPFEGRWKNSESKVWNDSIYSASKEELEQARRALAKNLL